jgi:hypothetical protein
MSKIDQKAIDRLKSLALAAPPSPWRFDANRSTSLTTADRVLLGDLTSEEAGAFIVAAREIVPALLAEVERLQANRGKLRVLLERYAFVPNGTGLQCQGCNQWTPKGAQLDHVAGCEVLSTLSE